MQTQVMHNTIFSTQVLAEILLPSVQAEGVSGTKEMKLYRQFNKDDELLYVGVSLYPSNRLSCHMNNSHWCHQIQKILVESHPTKEAALKAEANAIIREKPIHNRIVHGKILKEVITKKEIGSIRSKRFMDSNEVSLILAYTCQEEGSIARWTRQNKLEYWQVASVIRGDSKPSSRLLKAMGLRKSFSAKKSTVMRFEDITN